MMITPARAALLVALLSCAGCARLQRAGEARESCTITRKPERADAPIAWHVFDSAVLSRSARTLNPLRAARKLFRRPEPACNLAGGAVAESSFFTDRAISRLSAADMRAGSTKPGQQPRPPFAITRTKGEGKTAGFFVRDAKQDHYLLKFDVPGYPELITGAEVVTSKLLHALGYHVPSYEIVEMSRAEVTIDPKSGVTPAMVEELLRPRLRAGRIRASASRMIDGDIVGHITFKRYDCCAELRALRLAYAWLHNTDAKDHNSLLVWERGRGVGYLIDFGTSLGGEAEHGPKRPCQGWEYDSDVRAWALELLTLGLYSNGCDKHERPTGPAVGLFSARIEPRRWKPYVPNLAFDEMTDADGRWITERIMRLSAEQLAAALSAGRYSDPNDEHWILEVLEARRQAIAHAYAPELVQPAWRARLERIRQTRRAVDRQPPDWLVP